MSSTGGAARTARIVSAILLIAAGGIHLLLVLLGTGGLLGAAFVLNAVAGIALGIGMLLLRGTMLRLAAVLGLLFMIASLGALLTALTVGLFGIRTSWGDTLAPHTVVVESVGVVVLAVTVAMLFRPRPAERP